MKSLSKSLILVVDDNKDILFNIRLLLEAKGYDIITMESGIEAISILSESRKLPDLIISDISMPELNGDEAIPLIKESKMNASTPIFVLSGSLDEKLFLSLKDKIEKAFLKPIDMNEVSEYAESFLNK